jgi:hypothetical protein
MRIKKSWNALWEIKSIKWILLLVVLLLTFGWGLSLWRFPNLVESGEVIPLHYNIYFGVDSIGPWWHILILPVFATLTLIINFVISLWQVKEHRPFVMILMVTTVLVALLLDIALIFALMMNI